MNSILHLTLDTFTIGDPDIGPYLFETFRPPIIGPIQNQVMKFELEIAWVTFLGEKLPKW